MQPGNTPSLSESQPSPEPRVQSNAGSVENPPIGQADAAQKLNPVYSNAITPRTGPLGQPLGQQEMAAPGAEGERHEQPAARSLPSPAYYTSPRRRSWGVPLRLLVAFYFRTETSPKTKRPPFLGIYDLQRLSYGRIELLVADMRLLAPDPSGTPRVGRSQ